jgi:hypothetical protein
MLVDLRSKRSPMAWPSPTRSQNASVLRPTSVVTDLEGTREAFGEAYENFRRASEVAPEEIRADVEQIEQVLGDFSTVLRETDSDQEYQEQLLGFEDDFVGLQEPAERLGKFQEENCEAGGG